MAETAAYYKYSHLWTGSLKLVVSSQQKMRIKLDSLSLDRNEHSNNKKSVCNKKLPKDKEIFHFFSRKKTWLPVWPLRSSYLSSLEKGKRWCSTYKMVGKTPTCSFLGLRAIGYSWICRSTIQTGMLLFGARCHRQNANQLLTNLDLFLWFTWCGMM